MDAIWSYILCTGGNGIGRGRRRCPPTSWNAGNDKLRFISLVLISDGVDDNKAWVLFLNYFLNCDGFISVYSWYKITGGGAQAYLVTGEVSVLRKIGELLGERGGGEGVYT